MSFPAIASLVPHHGSMCLLEEVVTFDEARVHCRSASHRSPHHPLRDAGGLRALHLCEYGAQAMAVHGGLLARRDGAPPRPGMLVALRQVQLHAQYIDRLEGKLDVLAERLLSGNDSWQYAFRIEHGGAVLVEGRAAVVLGAAIECKAATSRLSGEASSTP